MVGLALILVIGLLMVLISREVLGFRTVLVVDLAYILSVSILALLMYIIMEPGAWSVFVDDKEYQQISIAAGTTLDVGLAQKLVAFGKNPGFYWISTVAGLATNGSMFAVPLMNVIIGLGIISLLGAIIVHGAVDYRYAALGALIFALLPDTKFWSLLQFKDTVACFLILAALFSASLERWLWLSLLLILLLTIRLESALLIVFLVAAQKIFRANSAQVLIRNFLPVVAICGLIYLLIPDQKWIVGFGGGNFADNPLTDFREFLNVSREISGGAISTFYILSIYDLWKLPFSLFVYMTLPFPFWVTSQEPIINLYQVTALLGQYLTLLTLLLIVRSPRFAVTTLSPSSPWFYFSGYLALEWVLGAMFMFEFSPMRHRFTVEVILLCIFLPVLVSREPEVRNNIPTLGIFAGILTVLLHLVAYIFL